MPTSVTSLNPRLISAVSPDPAGLMAVAAAELAARWGGGGYDLDATDALAALGCIRDTLRSLAGLLDEDSDQPYLNLYDHADGLAEDRTISAYAAKRIDAARFDISRATRELENALDRCDRGYA